MKNEKIESKIETLFTHNPKKKQFENHMPKKVGMFLEDAAHGKIEATILAEDIAFATSIAKAIQH